MIKASCRRRDATNLETTATVNLFVTDHNDARPIFERDEYKADIKQDVRSILLFLRTGILHNAHSQPLTLLEMREILAGGSEIINRCLSSKVL